jgi:hypothetical protein
VPAYCLPAEPTRRILLSTPSQRRQSSAPWIVAAVAGVVLAALLVVYFAVLVPDRNDAEAGGAGQLTSAEQAATVAAGTEMANLLTFHRASFTADFDRALAGTTGALHSDVVSKRSTTQKQLTSGKFDIGAKILHRALEGPTEGKTRGYLVLVVVEGFRSTAPTQTTQQNLEVTMVQVKGKWLAGGVTNIAVT